MLIKKTIFNMTLVVCVANDECPSFICDGCKMVIMGLANTSNTLYGEYGLF